MGSEMCIRDRVSGGSGGDASSAGFTISAGGSTVLAFSFTGATIPAGCGTLVNLSLDGDATSLSGIVVSDAVGSSIPFVYYVGSDDADLVADCSDEYPDCAANEFDCAGECGGDAVEDECGVCGGDNSCGDCAGIPNGDNVLDQCGVCDNDPSNDCVQDLSLIHI